MSTIIDLGAKRVLVVGAGSSLRPAIAEAFLAQGASVMEADVSAKGSAGGVQHYRAVLAEAITQLGGLDVLVTCTGIQAAERIENATLDTWEIAFLDPMRSVFFTTQAAVPTLIASRGAIVNVTSVLGLMGASVGLAIPAAAMACVVHHTRMLALRLSPDGVRVNAVCHGYLSDREHLGVLSNGDLGGDSPTGASIPLGRLAEPSDITGSVLFLASSAAGYMTGAIVANDGGRYGGS